VLFKFSGVATSLAYNDLIALSIPILFDETEISPSALYQYRMTRISLNSDRFKRIW